MDIFDECTPVIPVSVIPKFTCPSATSPNASFSYPEIQLAQRHESQCQLSQFLLSRIHLSQRHGSQRPPVIPVFIIFNNCACRWLLSVIPAGGPCRGLLSIMPAGGFCQLCLPGALVSCACRGSCQLCGYAYRRPLQNKCVEYL
jgi:hypothetical protein